MLREGQTALNGYLRIDTAIGEATETLRALSESPRLDAELLLARALDVPRSYLFAHAEEEMDVAALERYQNTISRRADGVPLAYLTGEKEFWSMMLMVSPATLVPRPETEILVDQALQIIPKQTPMRVLDLGTGSGAIALAIAKERSHCEVVATDISEDALAVARENARQHDVPNIEFLQGDWTEPVSERTFDIVLSNPPYVPDEDPHHEMLRHEPRLALASGGDGLDAIRKIAADAGAIVQPGGALLIEHGDTQHEAIAVILRNTGWTGVVLVKDLSGIPRVTLSSRPASSPQ